MSIEKSPVSTDINFEKDGKQFSYLRVPYSRNTSAWGVVMVPIVVIKNGVGKTVLFIGGNHGGEYEGPVALSKLSRNLQAEQIQGSVIIMPALNLPAVQAGERVSPIDGLDMNRAFPGKYNGSVTQVISHYVHEAILPLSDAVIDLHSGGYSLDLFSYNSMHYLSNEELRENTMAALKAFNAPVSLIMREFTGEGLLDYAVEGMEKIFLCAEIGGTNTNNFAFTFTPICMLNYICTGFIDSQFDCVDFLIIKACFHSSFRDKFSNTSQTLKSAGKFLRCHIHR